ncbi:hypothetical protein DFH08DRAFT_814013 [Mycena albidolilacea]|uniref:Uncharacterized protein n=1 Tax=Mycena albidolilacea TaxID=1033008 RepID=A0AAD7EK21_9AGAR|nr:hypothetical protein DFH08DRAFT_814013 [Mycena albidolilacea]
MSVTETESVLDSATPTLVFLEDATSDTEVEPPSPGGSTKGLYVRSRPTSMDGSIIEFPGFASEVDFTQFGMTAAPAATVTSPIEPPLPFPTPPIIRAPPVAKRRRYAASMKSLYTGTGTGTILKTNQAPIIPVRIVPRVLEDEPATPLPAKTRGWKALKKIVPGLFRRPIVRPLTLLDATGNGVADATAPIGDTSTESTPTTYPPPSSTRLRALSIRSFKSSKAWGKKPSAGVENLPFLPTRAAAPRPRVHSFSGYLADNELMDDEDETDAEMTAVHLEALGTVLKINDRYQFALVDSAEIGVAM